MTVSSGQTKTEATLKLEREGQGRGFFFWSQCGGEEGGEGGAMTEQMIRKVT